MTGGAGGHAYHPRHRGRPWVRVGVPAPSNLTAARDKPVALAGGSSDNTDDRRRVLEGGAKIGGSSVRDHRARLVSQPPAGIAGPRSKAHRLASTGQAGRRQERLQQPR